MKTRRTKPRVRATRSHDLATAITSLTQQIAALEKLVKELANRPPIYVISPAPYVPPITPISPGPGDWPIAPQPGVIPISPTYPSWSQPSITCKVESPASQHSR